MNKADLISAVAAEAGLSKVDAKKAVEAFLSKKVGKELLEDPEYLRRLEAGMIDTKHVELNDVKNMFHARISVIIFIAATLLIVLFGSIPVMRPVFNGTALDMPAIIEILMLWRKIRGLSSARQSCLFPTRAK